MGRMNTQKTLRASAEFWKKAKMAAVIEGVPVGMLLEKLVDQHISKHNAKLAKMPSPLHRIGKLT